MSDNKKELDSGLLVADIMLRITALEKLLIDKGVFSKEELAATTDEIAKRIAQVVLEKVQASKQIEELTKELEKANNADKKGLDN